MTGSQAAGGSRAMPAPGRVTEAEFRSLYERLRAKVPWGQMTGAER